MKQILFTQNQVALVDDEDYERVNQHKWRAHNTKKNIWYAVREVNGTSLYLHSFILNIFNKRIDHINHDGLNNQKLNLRPCTQSQNLSNLRKMSSATSSYKGVGWSKRSKKWWAKLTKNYKTINLGLFDSEEEAALVYNNAANKYFGEFANVNIL